MSPALVYVPESLIGLPGLFVAGLIGLVIGSFLNVVIYRLPLMLERDWRNHCAELEGSSPSPQTQPFNLIVPRSRCPSCGHLITAGENIPVLSYFLLRGRCRQCTTPISARYPTVELLAGGLGLLAAWFYGFTLLGAAVAIFCWVLLTLTFIDLDTQLLPDNLTLPLLWLGLIINAQGGITTLHSAVWGAVVGYSLFWSVYWLFKLITHKEGMGYGDFKLLAAIGAWTGLEMIPLVILISSVVGVVIGGLILWIRRESHSKPIPFGPYLAIAGIIAMYWGNWILPWYLGYPPLAWTL